MDQLSLDAVLTCVGGVAADAEAAGVWTAPTLDIYGGFVFGGQMLAQAIVAASRAVPDQAVRAITASFPRGASSGDGTLRYDVEALQIGSTYSTQRVELRQPDRKGDLRTAFTATVLSHRPGDGPSHGATIPAGLSGPSGGRVLAANSMVPWELRVDGDTNLEESRAQAASYRLWSRVAGPLPDESAVHQALLAYVSDLMLIGTSILPHEGWSQLDAHHTMRTSVIGHSVSFHRPFRADEWLLLDHTSPAAADGTAYGTANVFTESGELVASFSQESMVRFPDGGKL